MIEISNLRKVYLQGENELTALNDVTLTIPTGEIFGVVGASGAGKSTLIRCVNLLEKPTSGSVRVNGLEMTSLRPHELREARKKIGMIFQHFNLLSTRTVSENISFPLEIDNMHGKERQKKVKELLFLVGLQDKADAYPAQLSGGQKQRVGIARALANNPSLLLSDEATSALDQQNTTSILSLLKDLNQRLGLTILLITHEMEVVKQVCDRVAVLKEGSVLETGEIHHLISNPKSNISQAFFPPFEKIPTNPGMIQTAITFIGEIADQPVLSNLAKKFNLDVNIIGGSIQSIGRRRVGRLHVILGGSQINEALNYLRDFGLLVEVY